MKIPLRFQITEFDCGTVSLLNAFSYLFEREEIPALLVKQIHKYTLDCYDENGNLGNGGTSKEAINKLTTWITNYANSNDFDVSCERLVGEKVSYENLIECLNDKGVVFARCWQKNEHYIIITKIKKNKVYIFDPYYFEKSYYDKDKQVKIILNKPFTHNRIVSLKRLLSQTHCDFSLGPIDNRECVLMKRNSDIN
ncbi:MAG: cysteine peptidase family C39 domain-containing protein [Bacilli bacterium]